MKPEERMAALFRGLERAYGVSSPTGRTSSRNKSEARYATRRGAITPDLWADHLAGRGGLVVHPLRDDGTVRFGAIDVDVYPLDLKELAGRVAELKLPLVTCRTKSGGAHLYLFLTEPTDAERVQEVLMSWAAVLGYPHVEVFPKQVSLASDEDVGNGINVPYFDAEKTTRYAVDAKGDAVPLEAFLDAAEAARVAPDALNALEVDAPDLLDGAPPCLQHWARVGVGEGQRNEVMFDFAIYCRKRWPTDWPSRFEELNRRFCTPPLPAGEVTAITKSVGGVKEYVYRCKCEGPYAQPQICRRREFGRGGGYDEPNVVVDGMTIVQTDPPTYIVTVNGHRIEMTGDELRNQKAFAAKVEDTLFMAYRPLKPAKWFALRENLYSGADKVEAPEDAGSRGQLAYHLREFFDRSPGRDAEQLTLNRCWRDPEVDRMYFRSPDFVAYLKKNKVSGWRERDIFNLVRSMGGGADRLVVRGAQVRCWWVPDRGEAMDDLSDVDTKPDEEIPF